MFNRTPVVDQNFITYVSSGNLPQASTQTTLNDANLSHKQAKDFFHSQIISRHLDLEARRLKDIGRGFYTIGSSGHEGNAVLGNVFSYKDPSLLHYRSGAFVVQRSKQINYSKVISDTILSFSASSLDPISNGRHKVFGSKLLNIPPQTSTIASHLPKAVGLALSITRAKELKIRSIFEHNSIV